MSLKYPKPNIILVDIWYDCADALIEQGYNVSVGSYGQPYSVAPSDKLAFVEADLTQLPRLEEQEIIIVNTRIPSPVDSIPSLPGDGVESQWTSCELGRIDPRPLAMALSSTALNRIMRHGGIVIAFVGRKCDVEYVTGRSARHHSLKELSRGSLSSWCFCGQLDKIHSKSSNGIEMTYEDNYVSHLLKRATADASYHSVIEPTYEQEGGWVPLARNKYSECIAAALVLSKPLTCLIILPQMPQFHLIAAEFIATVCTQLRQKLFPYHQGEHWLHTEVYELPQVTAMAKEIDRLSTNTSQQIARLRDDIEASRRANSDWYSLLAGTGRELVVAVINSLTQLGFRDVVDVDIEQEGQLREDIQIRDTKPIVVVDIKGVYGKVEDGEATQSEKHALIRSREWKEYVKPLTIVNAERGLPPHERDPNPYRQELIDSAAQTGLGLMTTWDLFRVQRNKEAHGWSDDVVKPIFHRCGRIEPIPDHYVEIGRIIKTWKSSFGIIPTRDVSAGSKLAIETGGILYDEIIAHSLMVNDVAVATATVGSNCGIECDGASEKYKKDMRVFSVEQ